MTNFKELENIGKKIVRCNENDCEGIEKGPSIPPRGLYYEPKKAGNGKGIIIIGKNPGPLRKNEMKEYERAKSKRIDIYGETYKYTSKKKNKLKYYKNLQILEKHLKRKGYGNFVFSNIVKCQSEKNKSKSKLQDETARRCISKYLESEVKKLPIDWPIIAAGKEAYDALKYLFLDRKIIGIPHPSGSRGNSGIYRFNRAFNRANSKVKRRFDEILDGNKNIASRIILNK